MIWISQSTDFIFVLFSFAKFNNRAYPYKGMTNLLHMAIDYKQVKRSVYLIRNGKPVHKITKTIHKSIKNS